MHSTTETQQQDNMKNNRRVSANVAMAAVPLHGAITMEHAKHENTLWNAGAMGGCTLCKT